MKTHPRKYPTGCLSQKRRGKSPGPDMVGFLCVCVPSAVVGCCWLPRSGLRVLSGLASRPGFPFRVPFLFPWWRATTQEPIFQPCIPSRQRYRSMVRHGRGLGFWLHGCFYMVSSMFSSVSSSLRCCSRSSSQVVSHPSTFYVITAILTKINRTWVVNLAIFQRCWRLAHACCFVDRCHGLLEEDPVANFVVLPNYHEDEAMLRGPFWPTRTIGLATEAARVENSGQSRASHGGDWPCLRGRDGRLSPHFVLL